MTDTADITATAVELTAEDRRHFAMFNAGRDWAAALKPGDVFRGSYGEADHRGLTEWDAKFFSAGAQTLISGMAIYVLGDDSNTIHSIEPR